MLSNLNVKEYKILLPMLRERQTLPLLSVVYAYIEARGMVNGHLEICRRQHYIYYL